MAGHTSSLGAPPVSASASTLILLQVSARTLTFIFNQLLVRLVSPSIFGLANIQLELLLSTILFLSRDAIRTILIRNKPVSPAQYGTKPAGPTQPGPRKGTTNPVHNIALLPIPIGFAFTVVACSVYALYISPEAMRNVPTFYTSVALYAVGAASELTYEPLLIRAVRLGQPALRVKAEGAAVFAKVASTIAVILLLPRWTSASSALRVVVADEKSVALLAFGVGQALFGLTMLAVHIAHFVSRYSIGPTLDLYIPRPEHVTRSDARARTPSKRTVWLDRPTLSLCGAMAQQGILKHALTEADKFAVAKYATLEDQGGYALASAYGSLMARIVFQPVEETARIVFSSELVALDPDFPSPSSSIPLSTLERASSMLSALFRLHFLLACLMTAFGGPLSTAFLYIMAGPRWALGTSAPAILAAYTYYLPIMGINGIVEGFVQSVASKRQVGKYSRVLMGASVGFVGTLAVVKGGEVFLAKTGLVWANALSLGIRAGWCWDFLIKYFEVAEKRSGETSKDGVLGGIAARVRPTAALPAGPTLATFGLIAIALRAGVPKLMPSNAELLAVTGSTPASRTVRLQAIRSLLPTLALTGACLAAVVGAIALYERGSLVGSLRSLSRRSATKKDDRKTQ
ncbi:related to nuclear division protein Rft1 [Ustilago sp. UG-2017a]|nr:related to nuclear division protein Rft1 [Ustilago sp. UG-2017a]